MTNDELAVHIRELKESMKEIKEAVKSKEDQESRIAVLETKITGLMTISFMLVGTVITSLVKVFIK